MLSVSTFASLKSQILVFMVLLLGLGALACGGIEELSLMITSFIKSGGWWPLLVGAVVYCLLMIIPYFPGFEIGLLLMITFGREGAFIVYLATILSLTCSFFFGRYLANIKSKKRFEQQSIEDFLDQTPKSFLAKYWQKMLKQIKRCPTFIVLIVLLNAPGNSILGGGGGIAMAFGYKGRLSLCKFIAAVALAVCPIPLVFMAGFSPSFLSASFLP